MQRRYEAMTMCWMLNSLRAAVAVAPAAAVNVHRSRCARNHVRRLGKCVVGRIDAHGGMAMLESSCNATPTGACASVATAAVPATPTPSTAQAVDRYSHARWTDVAPPEPPPPRSPQLPWCGPVAAGAAQPTAGAVQNGAKQRVRILDGVGMYPALTTPAWRLPRAWAPCT